MIFSAYAHGLDVSHYDPVTDWAALISAAEKPSFIGIKATEGQSVVDPKLQEHRDGFRASPMLLAIYYHFARTGNPKVQANRFMDAIGPLDPRERLCLDLEVAPALGPQAVLDWVNAFYSVLLGPAGLSADRRPFIYTSERKWRTLVGNQAWDTGSADVDLWAPRYNNANREPLMPTPWIDRGWHIWQWTDGQDPSYTLPGVGACDGNLWNGDEQNLKAYMKASLIVAPGDA